MLKHYNRSSMSEQKSKNKTRVPQHLHGKFVTQSTIKKVFNLTDRFLNEKIEDGKIECTTYGRTRVFFIDYFEQELNEYYRVRKDILSNKSDDLTLYAKNYLTN